MTDNNKYIINTPKVYEIRYLENQKTSNLSKFASYLGIKTTYCSSKFDDTVERAITAVKTAEEVSKSAAATNFPVVPTDKALASSEKKADDFADRVERSGGEVEHRVERTGDTSAYYRK